VVKELVGELGDGAFVDVRGWAGGGPWSWSALVASKVGTGMAMLAGMQDSANHERPRGWQFSMVMVVRSREISSQLALLLPVRLSLPAKQEAATGALAF
jgi:hypothetical protein